MRIVRWALGIAAALILISLGVLWWQHTTRYAVPSAAAMAAATSDGSVRVDQSSFLTFRPLATDKTLGVIFYPGAYTDLRGYAPTLKRIAAAGYPVIAVPMPLDLSILGINRANDVRAAYPDIGHWAIIGHSVGGAAAAVFAHDNTERVEGVVIWDSFPPAMASLAAFPKPVWHIHRATPDGAAPETFTRQRGLFPANSVWVAVPGGIHMNFGAFDSSGYQEDWLPTISQAQQHDLVVDATLRALSAIESGLTKGPNGRAHGSEQDQRVNAVDDQ